jgi:acetylornithine deacetylase/succinyl-diaminopimelate desuccinylase-like protein
MRAYIERNLERYVDELSALCRFPSVATNPAAIDDSARFLVDALQRRGVAARLVPTAGYPVVFGEIGAGTRTLLLYNHYDVQPAEPLGAWDSAPFEPVRRDGTLVARGAVDDKGETVARLAALDALLDRHPDGLPLRIVFLIEGEEESGSPNLEPFLAANRDLLRADACIWEAGMVDGEGRPQIWLGVRGFLGVELRVRTLAHDGHSGWAHALPNAAWRLIRALSTLVDDDDERIRIDGFYDDVRAPSSAQERLLAEMPPEEDHYRQEYGIGRLVAGREGLELRRALFLPTCNISAIDAGGIDTGKTIVPGEARVAIDFRLVPDQDPDDLMRKLRAHLDRHGFQDVAIDGQQSLRAATVDPDHPFVALASAVARESYGSAPLVAPIVGGSGPAAHVVNRLGVPFVSLGCSYPGARKHAPNENIRLADFVNGASCIANVMERFAVT